MHTQVSLTLLFCMLSSLLLPALALAAPATIPPAKGERMICVGDSITDGNTYPQIIMQALKEAKKPVPAIICGGVVCDTIVTISDRLNKTILTFEPKVVTLTAGTNDASRGESPELYEQTMRSVVDRILATGAAVILVTPCIINVGDTNKPNTGAEATVVKYVEVMRKIADEKGLRVAENNALQRKARDEEGQRIMSPDGIHPNYIGQALMARSILDVMGYKDVPLPKTFLPKPYPGLVTEWKMRLTPVDPTTKKPQVINEKTVVELNPDKDWVTYTLPETPLVDAQGKPLGAEDWNQQLVFNGFGTNVVKRVGKGPVQAMAVIKRKKAGKAYISVGGDMSSLWLNGKKLDMPETNDAGKQCIIGFHAGKLRLEVEMQKGDNILVMENPGAMFFVGITENRVWEEQYCKDYK